MAHSTVLPRRKPLAACLAVVLGSAALIATSTTASAAWQRKHDNHPVTREHALSSANATLRHGPIDRQALRAHLRAKFGAHKAAVPNRPAATQTVTNCNDSGAGSLRDAIANAGSGDTIDLSNLACSTITLTTGAIATVLDDLTINGPGAANLTIDASGNDRALAHFGYGTLTVNDVTVANGYYENYFFAGGGCIFTTGSVTLNNSVVTGCSTLSYYYGYGFSFSQGGGVYAYGSATLTNSTISNSTTYGFGYYGGAVSTGGGVYSAGPVTLTNSTLSGNRVEGYAYLPFLYNFIRGGGVYGAGGQSTSITGSTIDNNFSYGGGGGLGVAGATLTLSNSTVSGNQSGYGYGGGVFLTAGSTATISNSTIADNYSYSYSGGLLNVNSTLDLQSTLVASNTSYSNSADADFAFIGYAPTGANNLIVTTTYTVPAGTLSTDPNLQALANNGGPTRTMALITGSSAIDAGNNAAGLATDQRGTGFTRVAGTAADIGAFELQSTAVVAATPVPAPSLSTWAQWLLAGALGLFGAIGFARRRPRLPTS
jgi:hypothetical protein